MPVDGLLDPLAQLAKFRRSVERNVEPAERAKRQAFERNFENGVAKWQGSVASQKRRQKRNRRRPSECYRHGLKCNASSRLTEAIIRRWRPCHLFPAPIPLLLLPIDGQPAVAGGDSVGLQAPILFHGGADWEKSSPWNSIVGGK